MAVPILLVDDADFVDGGGALIGIGFVNDGVGMLIDIDFVAEEMMELTSCMDEGAR